MSLFSFANTDYASSDKIQQHMSGINRDIAHLLDLAKDPQKYGELIEILEPTIDKIDKHILALQARLTEELDRKTKEFEASIELLNEPPEHLSAADRAKWHKFSTLGGEAQELDSFKKSLIENFKHEISQQLHVEKLTEQNITIRRILDKIRQTLPI